MSVLEILLWILGGFAAVLALGKLAHESKAKKNNVCSCCGQPLPSKQSSDDITKNQH